MRTTIDRAMLLLAVAAMGCVTKVGDEANAGGSGASTGGASTGGASTGGASGSVSQAVDTTQPSDIMACAARPELGAACDTYGAKCQIAEATCSSIFTCDDTWTEVRNCASPALECPSVSPESGVPCVKAGLTCRYLEACGEIDTQCKDGAWVATPVLPAECDSLCQDLCTRVSACRTSWAPSCLSACRAAHYCAGASKQDTAALCQARSAAIAPLDCKALCTNATLSEPRLGEDDCGE